MGFVKGEIRLESRRIRRGRLDDTAVLRDNLVGGAGSARIDPRVEADAETTILFAYDALEPIEEIHGGGD